jgi:Predicted integral membrane protein (DUF2269)
MPPSLIPILLLVHVALAISLFVPSLLLPFAFRARRGSLQAQDQGPFMRFLLAVQARGSIWIGIGLAITGVGLVAALGWSLLGQPWLLVALVIYAANLGIAFFIQRPRLRALLGLSARADGRWPAVARRQRYLSYVMAGLVGTIAFLMSAKPTLW